MSLPIHVITRGASDPRAKPVGLRGNLSPTAQRSSTAGTDGSRSKPAVGQRCNRFAPVSNFGTMDSISQQNKALAGVLSEDNQWFHRPCYVQTIPTRHVSPETAPATFRVNTNSAPNRHDFRSVVSTHNGDATIATQGRIPSILQRIVLIGRLYFVPLRH